MCHAVVVVVERPLTGLLSLETPEACAIAADRERICHLVVRDELRVAFVDVVVVVRAAAGIGAEARSDMSGNAVEIAAERDRSAHLIDGVLIGLGEGFRRMPAI